MTGPIAAAGAELQATLVSFVRENRLPGGSAGVVHGGGLAWSGTAGFADTGARRATGPGTLYRIASITKPFTGTAIMQLRDAGRLDLDDPAVSYLPELRGAVSPFAPIETVTIRRMLSHESGLSSEPPGTDWAGPVYQGDPGCTLARAGQIVLASPPNAQHKYSDLAYQLLGEIVTRVSGVPYPQYLRESVLAPLGLADTGFEPLDGPQLGRCATGYDWRALSDALDVAPGLAPPVWAEGGLWSSVPDLARWVSFQLGAYGDLPDGPDGLPVLAAGTRRQMHKPRYLGGGDWGTAWGISWCANRRDGVTWIQHSGWVPGFTGTVCFDPVSQVGAVALVNGTGDTTELALGLASAARQLAQATPGVITAPEPVPAGYRPLLGFYVRPQLGGWVLRLEWRDGELAFTAGDPVNWQLALVPTGDPDVFAPRPGSDAPGDSVTFRRLGDGRVASVHLMDSTFIRLDQVGAPG